MITYKAGNLLEAEEILICHQCNTRGVMGAGLAKQIASKWPEVRNKYIKHLSSFSTNLSKSNEDALGEVLFVIIDRDKYICNLFSQADYGITKKQTDYYSLETCLIKVRNFAKANNYSVALPYKIGCGLGGGDWSIVEKIIENVFSGHQVTIYKLEE